MCAVDCDEEVEDGDGGTLSLCPFVGGPLGSWLDVISQSEGGGLNKRKALGFQARNHGLLLLLLLLLLLMLLLLLLLFWCD